MDLNAHILQVIPRLDAGGAERTTVDVSTAIVQASGRSTVASAGGRLASEVEAGDARLFTGPFDSKSPWTLWRNRAALTNFIRAEHVDLIHARSRAPAWSALWAARAARLPLVTTYHGAYSASMPWKRFYNSSMTRGDIVIANSAFIRDQIAGLYGLQPDRIAVIPRGVDLQRFDPDAVAASRIERLREKWGAPVSDRRLIVLLPGRLTAWKGQNVLVEAAYKLKESGQGEHFLFILAGEAQGRGSYRDDLERLIGARRVGNMVKMVGHCSDMPAALTMADVVVSASVRPEAFGRIAVEAQAMQRAVIAADHGGARETVDNEHTGWLVPPGDADALAARLLAFQSADAATRARMGEAGRRRTAKMFSKDAMCAATLDVYRRVLTKRRSAAR